MNQGDAIQDRGGEESAASRIPAEPLTLQPAVSYEFLDAVLDALANPQRLRLLGFLTRPHYLEEIGQHLGMTRQAADKHLEKLVAAGLLERRAAIRPQGRVVEFVINPQVLFVLHDEIGKLGTLRRDDPAPDGATRVDPDPRAPSMPANGPCLVTVRGLHTGARHLLSPGGDRRWVVGRAEDCDVVVGHDPYASQRHAEVAWKRGGFFLTDLHSANGTVHNWSPLPRGSEVALAHGDVLGIGKTLLLFWEAPRARVWTGPGDRERAPPK